MRFNIYSVKDNLTNKFLTPMFIKSDEEAIRIFDHMINTTPIWKSNPSHFDLWYIGQLDDETGIVDVTKKMIQGGTAVAERTKDA